MASMREGVRRGRLKLGGWDQAFGRLFSGENFIFNKFSGTADAGDTSIRFAPHMHGDIIAFPMQPGQEAIVARGSYVASSPNVRVSGKMNWKGFIPFGSEEGFVLPHLKCSETEGEGIAWLGTYGYFHKHELKEGENLTVDNGLFLACTRHHKEVGELYELVQMGETLVSSLFGAEGLGMKFSGPCTLYTQSHNIYQTAAVISQYLPHNYSA